MRIAWHLLTQPSLLKQATSQPLPARLPCPQKCATCPDCKRCNQTTGYCTLNKASGSTCTGGKCNASGNCLKVRARL